MNASAADFSDFLQTIANEAELVQRFVELLTQEQAILTEGKIDELPSLADKKEKLATELNTLTRLRSQYLTSQGYTADRPGMQAWSSKHPEHQQALASWDKTLTLAAQAKELNRLNGQLIQLRMQYNSQALEILRRKDNPLDLYGPDGRSSLQGDRKINDVV